MSLSFRCFSLHSSAGWTSADRDSDGILGVFAFDFMIRVSSTNRLWVSSDVQRLFLFWLFFLQNWRFDCLFSADDKVRKSRSHEVTKSDCRKQEKPKPRLSEKCLFYSFNEKYEHEKTFCISLGNKHLFIYKCHVFIFGTSSAVNNKSITNQ